MRGGKVRMLVVRRLDGDGVMVDGGGIAWWFGGVEV